MSAYVQVHHVEDVQIETVNHDGWGVVRMTIKTRHGDTSIDLYVGKDFDKRILVTKVAEFAHEA